MVNNMMNNRRPSLFGKRPGMRLLLLLLSLSFASCADMFELEEETTGSGAKMKIDRTAIDIMVGDTYTINVLQSPEDSKDLAVAWVSANPKVATFVGGELKAVAPGHTTVTVEWLSQKLKESCTVNVYPKWEAVVYPYDMMVYAQVTVGGRPVDQDCIVAAFSIDEYGKEEVRGVGQLLTEYGITYMALRVFWPQSLGDDLVLRCYDRQRMLVSESEEPLRFNESGLGSLSALYKIEFD